MLLTQVASARYAGVLRHAVVDTLCRYMLRLNAAVYLYAPCDLPLLR